MSLAGYLQSKVAGRWGSGVLSVSPSADPRFKTFLTAFNPFKAYNDPSQFSTHALYNDPGEIDEMFRQVVKAIDATGLPQA